ncbi:uncharacterized protein RJT20DRAFT_111960 [Scheffersomyces xylosifermentans]|uniref:uncharacterized protein n=1 Tax=Scheffersomyces xylosifermentans TaxID=1304137 RepID=UPI00315DA124
MKLSNKALAAASIIALSEAAPLFFTRFFTAPAVTQYVTYTTATVITTDFNIATFFGPPPPRTTVATTTSTSTTPTTTSTSTTPTTTTSSTSPTSTTPTTTSTSTTPTTTSSSTTPTTTSSSTTPTTTSSSTTPTTPATSTEGSDSVPTTDVAFANEIVNAHNQRRGLHGVGPLQWSNTLAKYAADYAARTFSCDNVKLVHSGGPYGENLAAGYVGGTDPVTTWYKEIKDYNFNNPGFSSATSHFTQVVWKSTTKLGCARVKCSNAWRQYTICEYSDQRGNISGTDPATGKSYFEENVVPPV